MLCSVGTYITVLQDEKSHRFLYAILFQSLSEQSDKNSLN